MSHGLGTGRPRTKGGVGSIEIDQVCIPVRLLEIEDASRRRSAVSEYLDDMQLYFHLLSLPDEPHEVWSLRDAHEHGFIASVTVQVLPDWQDIEPGLPRHRP